MKRWPFLLMIVVLLLSSVVSAEDKGPHKPSPGDKCPVCGMFVHKYPDWTAEIVFNDGSFHFFDGAKDLFKFYLDLGKYAPSKDISAISVIYVTEYYDMMKIDARSAYFVMGSDVIGPMGRELIPLKGEAEAVQFKKDHKGARILTFGDITAAVIRKLD